MEMLCVTVRDKIKLVDTTHFKECGEIPITLFKSESREDTQVLSMQLCQNEQYLAVLTGLKLINNKNQINQCYIFKRVKGSCDKDDTWKQEKRCVIKDYQEDQRIYFMSVCLVFYFQNNSKREKQKLIFANTSGIFSLDFNSESIEEIYKFATPLVSTP